MRARASRVGRWLLLPIVFPLRLLLRFFQLVWRQAGRAGLWLRRQLTGALRAVWAFLGRLGLALRRLLALLFSRPLSWLGLALRHLLARLIWRPLAWIERASWATMTAAWRFLGRLGLALRHLLTRFIWRPLAWTGRLSWAALTAGWRFLGRLGLAARRLFTTLVWRPLLVLTAPLRWLYRRLLRPPLAWIGRLFWRLLRRLFGPSARAVAAVVQARWDAARRVSRLRRRRLASRAMLWRARLRVAIRRPVAPAAAIVTPRIVLAPPRALWRPTPLIATLLALNVALVGLGFMLTQPGETGRSTAARPMSAKPLEPEATPTSPAESATPSSAPPLAAQVLLTPWPTPDNLGNGGSVAFTLRGHGHSDIYALSVGRSEPLRLTNHPADERDPAWSPDGRQLAFASNRSGNWEIYLLDVPSGILRRVTDSPGFDGAPDWSPDGQWLVYESYQQNNLDLYLIRADGSGQPIRLTHHPAPDFSPAWSPGGRHIAFTSWRSGNKDIFIMPLDAASDETAVNVSATPGGFEDNAAFSPDGRFLAYEDDSTGFSLVYTVALDDYRPASRPASLGQQGRQPSWSPDSHGLLFVHTTESRSFLLAGSADAWGVASQAYASDAPLEDPDWSAVTLPADLPTYLGRLAQWQDPPLYREALEPALPEGPPYLLWRVAVNAPSPYLSDRVDDSYRALRQRVAALAGWDFLGQVDNMYEPLTAQPAPGQSGRSWNKAGRAFDFYFRYALADDPQVEVIRQEHGYETYWRVYLKAALQDGSQGEPLRDLPWDFRARYGFDPQFYDQGGKLKDYLPTGYYVDFTALAADYGWNRVPAAESWRTYFPAIRFWHYESRQQLSWEQAMLELYPAAELLAAFER